MNINSLITSYLLVKNCIMAHKQQQLFHHVHWVSLLSKMLFDVEMCGWDNKLWKTCLDPARKLQGSCQKIARILPGNCKDPARKSQGSCQEITRILWGNCKDPARKLPGSCQEIARILPGNCKDPARKLQNCKDPARKLQGSLRILWILARILVRILPGSLQGFSPGCL